MLAVSSQKYYVPRKRSGNSWYIKSSLVDDDGQGAKDYIISDHFHYTITPIQGLLENYPNVWYDFRITFEYNGSSVKPAMRTLRKYGYKRLQPIISRLATQNKAFNKDDSISAIALLTDLIEDGLLRLED